MTPELDALQLVSSGLLVSVQDKGRKGLRHLGIPWAGTLCPAWQEIANALVGNDADAPVLECFEGGLHLQALTDTARLAIVGDESVLIRVTRQGDTRGHLVNSTLTLAQGDSVQLISTGQSRLAIVAIEGIAIEPQLGSTSTYAKASLGGLDGCALNSGDTLKTRLVSAPGMRPDLQCTLPEGLRYRRTELRVIPGPQYDHFSDKGQRDFTDSDYVLSNEADRMGARFNGMTIEHRDASSKDIVSDAIMPGSIQIPGTGLPIVMLNDAHTAGGYPKIATVISVDLPLAGLQRAGSVCRFRLITIDEAIAARAHVQTLIASTISSISPHVAHEIDTAVLLANNLIDGVTDGS